MSDATSTTAGNSGGQHLTPLEIVGLVAGAAGLAVAGVVLLWRRVLRPLLVPARKAAVLSRFQLQLQLEQQQPPPQHEDEEDMEDEEHHHEEEHAAHAAWMLEGGGGSGGSSVGGVAGSGNEQKSTTDCGSYIGGSGVSGSDDCGAF